MKRAFTVPEMLAVVAIVVIILSLLLPAIQTARVPAYQALCANNNRQIIQASLTYATQNQGWMPFTNWLSQEDGAGEWQWGGWLYKYPGGWAPGGQKTGQLWPILAQDSIYRCPVDVGPYMVASTHTITSYLMNGAYSGFGGNPTFIYKRFKFSASAIMLWEVDSKAGPGSYNDGSSFPSEPVTDRHQTGLTVGCHDGHTEWLTYAQYGAILAPNPGRLWCQPP